MMVKEVNKKGQLTIFILVAIIIVVVALLVYFLFINKSIKQDNVSTTKTYIQDSINNDILRNIVTVLVQGGYANPRNYVLTPQYTVAYWIENNLTNIPSKANIEKEIDLLNAGISEVNLSSVFKSSTFSTGNFTSNTTIMPDKILVTINWPITIKQGTTTQRIENFNFEYKIRAGKLYDAAKYAAASAAMGEIPLEMPQDMNLTIYMYDRAVLYEIIDINEAYTINDKHASIVFAKKR